MLPELEVGKELVKSLAYKLFLPLEIPPQSVDLNSSYTNLRGTPVYAVFG